MQQKIKSQKSGVTELLSRTDIRHNEHMQQESKFMQMIGQQEHFHNQLVMTIENDL